MDDVDKEILILVLRNGSITQREIADKLGLSPQLVNYRLRRLLSEGVLNKPYLYIHPNFFGFVNGYIAVDGEIDSSRVIARFSCIDGVNIYELYADSVDELRRYFREIGIDKRVLVTFIPDQDIVTHRSMLDSRILGLLSRDPETPLYKIAEELELSRDTVVRHVKALIKAKIMKVIPIIDIPRSGITLFMVISSKLDIIRGEVSERVVWDFSRGNSGLMILFSRDIGEVKNIIYNLRLIDDELIFAIKYAYEYFPYYRNII